jgi:hypothetical protein
VYKNEPPAYSRTSTDDDQNTAPAYETLIQSKATKQFVDFGRDSGDDATVDEALCQMNYVGLPKYASISDTFTNASARDGTPPENNDLCNAITTFAKLKVNTDINTQRTSCSQRQEKVTNYQIVCILKYAFASD